MTRQGLNPECHIGSRPENVADSVRINRNILDIADDTCGKIHESEQKDKEIEELKNKNSETLKKLQESEESLKEALLDPLTGYPHRTWIQKFQEKKIFNPEQSDGNIVVCMIDFNNLKKINDTLGHNDGDAYLKRGASLIADAFNAPDSDMLAQQTLTVVEGDNSDGQVDEAIENINSSNILMRIGGDEFMLMYQGRDIGEVNDRFEGILENNNDVSFAFGAVLYDREKHGDGLLGAKDDADVAMYIKKTNQKSTFSGRDNYR